MVPHPLNRSIASRLAEVERLLEGDEMHASHEYIDHTAELQLRIRGRSPGELLAEAGRALGELLAKAASREGGTEWRILEVRATDRDALLVDWLNELLYVADVEHLVAVDFDLIEATETSVRARARCVPVAEAPAFVKAATHHGLRICEVPGGWEAEVILDV